MRKTIFGRAAALLLCAAMLLPGASAAGQTAPPTTGQALYSAETALTPNLTLTRGIRYADSRKTEHYFTYTPNETVVPMIVYGSKVCNYGNFATMAELLQKQGHNVLGGVNGDYYVMATDMPLGILIRDGELCASDAGLWGVGFRADGTAFIGKPALKTNITLGTETYRLGGINKTRNDGDYYLFTDQFAYSTCNTTPGRDVILSLPQGAKLTANCDLMLTVDRIVDSEGALPLPEGKLVLSLSDASDSWRQSGINALYPGAQVHLTISCDAPWDEAVYAMGSLYKLVTGGVAETIKDDKDSDPRTAVGIRADGTVLLYTVDGRRSGYSSGYTFAELSQRLIELGCVEACAMDGGGSTNLQARYVGDTEISPVNRTSGAERSVSCYIMLASRGAGSGRATNLAVYPWDNLVLSGSALDFTVSSSDESGWAVASPEPVLWSVEGGGSVDGAGHYVAGAAGADLVRAQSGGLSAASRVTVLGEPETMKIYNERTGREQEALTISCGETVDLTVVSTWRSMDVYSSDTAYSWQVDENVGTVDAEGLFTASGIAGSGMLTVTKGEKSVSVEVTVRAESTLVDEFETSTGLAVAGAGTELALEHNRDYVARGGGALAVRYDLSAGEARLELPVSTPKGYLNLWLWGDGSGNALWLEDEAGERTELATMDWTGWQNLTVRKGASVAALVITGEGGGLFRFDHIVATSTDELDTTPPQTGGAIEPETGILRANVIDGVDGVLARERISLTCDGLPLSFDYSSQGDVTAQLPQDELSHRLTLRATDVSGNIAVQSWQCGESGTERFLDLDRENWANAYVGYLVSLGVVNGYEEDEGMSYRPANEMTRQEFAAVLCRWLRIDTSLYAETELPYADLEDIQGWALDYVKAVTALGLITGSSADGQLYFRPQSSLTRAQIMTVLGRNELWGGAESSLEEFSDAESVPAWSLRYVRALVARGAVGGKPDGTLDPNGPVTRAQVAKILAEMT